MSNLSGHENAIGPGLVNQALLFREVLPRLYRGTVGEFLRELLLNSVRAQAPHADFTVLAPGRFTYRDDGTGIDGIPGLFNVLCIANSRYEDEAVEPNQRPLGLGFYALIVHPNVRRVRLESNTIAFDIDTRRWLEDGDYQASWLERVEKRPAGEPPGFFLLVEGEESLTDEVVAQLRLPNPDPHNYWVRDVPFGPARGYTGLLSIRLDGEPVETDLPYWFVLERADIVDVYQGNPIRIALSETDFERPLPPEFTLSYFEPYTPSDSDRTGLRLLWYGQPISDRGIPHLRVFLDVRNGAPLTAQAPTRAALVQDRKLTDLYAWVIARVFRHVCHEVTQPPASQVELLYKLDRGRAERECPWVLLSEWRGLPPQPADTEEQQIGSYYDLETLTVGHERAVRKQALEGLLVLDEKIVVLLPGTHPVFKDPRTGKLPEGATADPRPFDFEYGLPSFIAALGLQVYKPGLGARPNGVLWWRPGEPASEYYASDLGCWGIGQEDEPPREWRPVPAGSLLYVHDEIESWSIDDVRFFVGVATKHDLVAFLQQYARALWYLDEEGENSDEAFDESVADLIRELLGDTIAAQFVEDLLWAAAPFFGGREHAAQISTVELLRAEGGGGLRGIRVRLLSGESKELSLY
jgi:hypothetical protein